MADFYNSIGLPVWVVDDYSELEHLTVTDLEVQYRKLVGRFSSEALWMEFWLERISRGGAPPPGP